MNVMDSSGWLEYFADGPNADFFAAIEATSELIVPTSSLFQVFKHILQQRGEGEALQAAALESFPVLSLIAPPPFAQGRARDAARGQTRPALPVTS
jgi:hypothetical protein